MRNAGPAYGRFISHEQVNVSHVVAFLARSVMKTALVLIAIVGVAGYFVFTSSDFMNFDPTKIPQGKILIWRQDFVLYFFPKIN